MKNNPLLVIASVIAVLIAMNFYSTNFMAVLMPNSESTIDLVGTVPLTKTLAVQKNITLTKFDITVNPVITATSDPKSVDVDVGLEGVDFTVIKNTTLNALNQSVLFMNSCNATICEIPVTFTSKGHGSINVVTDVTGVLSSQLPQKNIEQALITPRVGWGGILIVGIFLIAAVVLAITKKKGV